MVLNDMHYTKLIKTHENYPNTMPDYDNHIVAEAFLYTECFVS